MADDPSEPKCRMIRIRAYLRRIPRIAPAVSPKSQPVLEDSPASTKTESTTASPAVRAVQDGIYAVVMEAPDKSKRLQVGTAWAISKRYLVTSATVVTAIGEYRQQGLIASVVQYATDKTCRIKSERLHDSYRKAVESGEEAREKRNDTRFAADRATQVRFDLGSAQRMSI